MSELRGEARARYVGAMFARIVRRYDLMNTLMTLGLDRSWRQLAVEMAGVGAGGLALDVAAGTGELTLALARAGTRLAVGADFSPEMLEAASAKASRLGVGRAEFAGGDALALPFPDDTFDAATVGFGLRNVGDLPRALAELRRVVRPGGRVVSLDLTQPHFAVSWLAWPYLRWVVPFLGGLVTGDREAYTYLPRSVDEFPAADRLAALMHAAGLRQVRYRFLGLGTVAIHIGVKPVPDQPTPAP